MKKNYITPSMKFTPVQMSQMICVSDVFSNVDFKYGGGTSNIEDFDPGTHVRSKGDNESSLWYDWNDIDEEE